MDYPDLTVSNFIENSICLKKVNASVPKCWFFRYPEEMPCYLFTHLQFADSNMIC